MINPLTDIPEREPESAVIGDTWTWKRTDLSGVYDNTLYTLRYYFNSRSTGASMNVAATASGSDFLISIPAATTAGYTASDRARGQSGYVWEAYMTRLSDSARVRLGYGTLDVVANLAAQAAGFDARSHVKKVLDAIEAVLENRATLDQQEYEIHGRKLVRTTVPDLLKLRDHYKTEYQKELDSEKVRRGLGTGRRVVTRFVPGG